MNEAVKLKEEPSDSSAFDDALRTLASAAIERDSMPIKKEPPNSVDKSTKFNSVNSAVPEIVEPPWFDVGIIKSTSWMVNEFYNTLGTIDHSKTNSDNLPDYSGIPKLELRPGTAYKFRVAAINSCGRGEWSDVSAFKTCFPGFPGAPSSIRISKYAEGAKLQWEPPALVFGKIIEYSVCLAVKKENSGEVSLKDLTFVRVYSGPDNHAFVDNSSLKAAYVDKSVKPAIIFRIAARNEKGYGPATQVRWLQDLPQSPVRNSDRKDTGKKMMVPKVK